jgi:hypothetical protein
MQTMVRGLDRMLSQNSLLLATANVLQTVVMIITVEVSLLLSSSSFSSSSSSSGEELII